MARRGLNKAAKVARNLLEFLLQADDIPAKTESQQMAKTILQMREQGRAREVTDEMMALADPETMYMYTPLPMDEVSRMDRARQWGGQDAYHGSGNIDLMAFDVPDAGQHIGTVYGSSKPSVANTYIDENDAAGIIPMMIRQNRGTPVFDNYGRPFSRINPAALDKTSGNTLDVIFNDGIELDTTAADLVVPEEQVSHLTPWQKERYKAQFGYNVGQPTTTDYIASQMDDYDIPAIRIDNILDRGPYSPRATPNNAYSMPEYTQEMRTADRDWELQMQKDAREPATDFMVRDPSLLRSRFARFDPEFSHLRNLSAAVPVSVGLAQMLKDGTPSKDEIEEYLKKVGAL